MDPHILYIIDALREFKTVEVDQDRAQDAYMRSLREKRILRKEARKRKYKEIHDEKTSISHSVSTLDVPDKPISYYRDKLKSIFTGG